MTLAEAKQLDNGLYVLYWKSGDWSYAAVGRLHDGTPWFAPSNWTANNEDAIVSTKWRMVDDVVNVGMLFKKVMELTHT